MSIVNIYGMLGGASPRYPETENEIFFSDWLEQMELITTEELTEGISLESWWQEGYTPEEVKEILERHKEE